MDKIQKIFSSEIKQIGTDEDRILRFTTSTEAIDRDGDIISVDGWKLDNYLKNPVILYGHNYEGLPIGKSVSTIIDSINKKLVQDVKFPTKDEYEFADTVYKLAKAGYLNATSVGFIGLDSEPRLDEKGNWLGKKYKKQELLETSIVPVPSNPTALLEARSKGIISDKELKTLQIEKEVDPPELKEVDEAEAKALLDAEQKAGAAISAKNRQMMKEAMGHMQMAMDMMGEMMGTMPEEEGEHPMEPMKSAMRTVNNEELKTVLDEIKSQVLLLCQKDAPKDINLDAIEYTPLQKDAAQDELNIEPEVLKNMIKEIISNNLQGVI